MAVATPATHPRVAAVFTEIAETLSSHSSLDDLMQELVRKVRAMFEAERSSIFLHESQSGLFHGYVADDPADPDGAAEVKRLICGTPADGFTLELVATRKPLLIANARLDPRPPRVAVKSRNMVEILGMPLVAQGEVVGLIFLDDPGKRHGFSPEDVQIAAALGGVVGMAVRQVRGAEALRESAAKIARHNKFLQRGRTMQDRLTQLALEAAGIQDLADAVVTVTGEPCLIYDAEMRRLGSGVPEGHLDPIRSIFDADIGGPSEISEVVAAVEEGSAMIIGPYRGAGIDRRAIVAPIRARDRNWGYVVIPELSRRLNSLDMGVAKQVASIVAVEFSASRHDGFLDTEARDALIRDLLDGSASARGLRDRASSHGLKLDERYVVVIFHPREGSEIQLSCPIVDAALCGTGWRGTPAATELEDGTIVSLIPLGSDEPTLEATRRVRDGIAIVAELLSPDGDILGAISSACLMPSECALAFDEARHVLDCMLTVGLGSGSILSADDLGVGRLMLGSARQAEAQRFAEQTLGPLLDAESTRGGELLQTLSAFVDCGRSVRLAAVHLSVHENTIRYRLSRMTELTGLDPMMNADHQLSCQLAVMILRLQGRLACPEAAPIQAQLATV